MRRVKKTTTNEQFDLLKSEMSVNLAAARGYGMGADRATVDAEWREIVEKLNAIGPPQRSLAEWKKVWSDYRARHLKDLSRDFLQKPKNRKPTAKKNKVVSSNKSNSIAYIAVDEEKPCLMELNLQAESQYSTKEEYYHHHQDPFKDNNDERNSSKEQYYNSSLHSLEEHEEFYGTNDSNNYKSYCHSPHDSSNDQKLNYLNQSLGTIELQIKNQNIMMEHLSKVTENLTELMERHVTNLEKQNQIMERQLRATERHNMFLRRQEARRKVLSKCNKLGLEKS